MPQAWPVEIFACHLAARGALPYIFLILSCVPTLLAFSPGCPMLSHDRIWAAIDALAARYGLSASGLARKAGLDATSFNKSKRTRPPRRDRWPSTESVAKILRATGAS